VVKAVRKVSNMALLRGANGLFCRLTTFLGRRLILPRSFFCAPSTTSPVLETPPSRDARQIFVDPTGFYGLYRYER